MSWFVIASLFALPAVAFAMYLDRRKRLSDLLEGRRPADLTEIFKSNYVGKMDYATFMVGWMDVSQCLSVDARFIRPEDRLGIDVGFSAITNEELDELAHRVIRHAKTRGSEIDVSRILTVDDYVLAVGKALAPSN